MRIVTIALCFLLGACAITPKADKTNYKIQLGKKCSKDNTTFSYLWFVDVVGDEAVKSEYCNDRK